MKFKNNPCEKHINVSIDNSVGFCPICLLDERDALQEKVKKLQAEKDSRILWQIINEDTEAERDLAMAICTELNEWTDKYLTIVSDLLDIIEKQPVPHNQILTILTAFEVLKDGEK